MTKRDARAIIRSITKNIRKDYGCSWGWDFNTFHAVMPRRAAVFQEACETLTGDKRRFVPGP